MKKSDIEATLALANRAAETPSASLICLSKLVRGGKAEVAIFGCKPVVEQIADVTGF